MPLMSFDFKNGFVQKVETSRSKTVNARLDKERFGVLNECKKYFQVVRPVIK